MDLTLEGFQRGEVQLVPESLVEEDLEFVVVEITGEIEEVHFELESRGHGLNRRTISDINHGVILDPTKDGGSSVDSRGRQYQASDIDIGGRNPQLATPLIAVKNVAGHGIRTTQEGVGRLEITALDGVANPGAADRLTVELNGWETSDSEAKFTAELLEKRKVALTPISEGEGGANTECLDPTEIVDQIAYELFSGYPAECGIEGDQPGHIESGILESTKPLRE